MTKEEKQALAQQAYEKAVQYELDYGCCPQCVLTTLQETLGIIEDQTIKASHGLWVDGSGCLWCPHWRVNGAKCQAWS